MEFHGDNIEEEDNEPVMYYEHEDSEPDGECDRGQDSESEEDSLELLLNKKLDSEEDVIEKIQANYVVKSSSEPIQTVADRITKTSKDGKPYKAEMCKLCGGTYSIYNRGNHLKSIKHNMAESIVDSMVAYIRP